MTDSDGAPNNSKSASPWDDSQESGSAVASQGAQPWGNLNATLTVGNENEQDSLSPLSYSSGVEPAYSAVNYESNLDAPAEDGGELLANFRLNFGDVVHSPSLNSALDFDTRSSDSRGGVQPSVRSQLNADDVPTINEMATERKTAESNLEISHWLDDTIFPTTSDQHVRPRANTTNYPRGSNRSFGLQQSTSGASSHLFIPGPNAILREDNPDTGDDGDDDDDDDEDTQSSPSDASVTPNAVIQYRSEVEPHPAPEQNQSSSKVADNLWHAHPWQDQKQSSPKYDTKAQPISSSAAMERFNQQVRDVETASWTATLGSRRRSETDIDSIFSLSGASTRPSNAQLSQREPASRRLSLLQKWRGGLPRSSNSNQRKRKGGDSPPEKSAINTSPPDSHSHIPQVRDTISSWGRPKSPLPAKYDDKAASSSLISGRRSPIASLRRVRSYGRSSSDSRGIADIWAAAGGPPVALLSPKPDQTDDSPQTIVSMQLEPKYVPASGDDDHLMLHIRKLNPRIQDFLADRMLAEQKKRLRRLLEYRAKHMSAVRTKNCPSGIFCNVLGSGSQILASPSSNQPGSQVIFVIDQSIFPYEGMKDDDKSTQPAVFPPGIPTPPVSSLPAKFECPICYQVKSFDKPSDWTKHVHEDVQPFTCTFPKCLEARSFKRKADYQRHENERHRHLESWVCSYQDCTHVCHRRDNFIQHLIREHRYKTHEPHGGRSSRNDIPDPEIARLVKDCRQETPKQPTDEPCHFCHNLLTTWRALATHSAKHMEQISLPLLSLLENIMPILPGASEPMGSLSQDNEGALSQIDGGASQPPNLDFRSSNASLDAHSGPAFDAGSFQPSWHPPHINIGFPSGATTYALTRATTALPSIRNSSNYSVSGTSSLAPPEPQNQPRSHPSPFSELSQTSNSSSNQYFRESYAEVDPAVFGPYGYDQDTANLAPLYSVEHGVSESPDAIVFSPWEESQAYQQSQGQDRSRPLGSFPVHQAQTWPSGYIYNISSPELTQQGQRCGPSGGGAAAAASAAMEASSYPPPQISVSYHQVNAQPPEDVEVEPETRRERRDARSVS